MFLEIISLLSISFFAQGCSAASDETMDNNDVSSFSTEGSSMVDDNKECAPLTEQYEEYKQRVTERGRPDIKAISCEEFIKKYLEHQEKMKELEAANKIKNL